MRYIEIDTVLLKTASRCNLDCTYCYVYQMQDDSWRRQPKRMPPEVVDAVISELRELALRQSRPFSVCLHGGEPLLLGFNSIRRLVSGLRGALPKECGIHVQTNGLLLTNAFIEMFATFDVGISISLDGPKTVHDVGRPDKRGGGSHSRVLEAIDRLIAHPRGRDLFTGVLAVVDVAADPGEVYRALKATGAPSLDFLYRDGNWDTLPHAKSSHNSTEYGDWMCKLLDIYAADISPPRVRLLDDMMRLILGGQTQKEGLGITEFGIVVVDTDGTVTKNDTLKAAHGGADLFDEKWSVLDHGLIKAISSEQFSRYHDLQTPNAPECSSCPDLQVCGGGMPAHRWSTAREFANPSVYCADQKKLIDTLRSCLAAVKAAA